MNSSFLFYLFTACFFTFMKAQTFQITKSEEFEMAKVSRNNQIFGHDKEAYYHYHNTAVLGGKYIIQKTNIKDGKVVFRTEVDIVNDPAYTASWSALVSNVLRDDKILVFVKLSRGEMLLLMQQYSAADGRKLSNPIVIERADNKLFSPNSVNLEVKFSPDHTKMLVITEIKRSEKEQKVTLKLYGEDRYKPIWEKEAATLFQNSTISSVDYRIDNAGNIAYVFSYLYSKSQADITYGIGFIPYSSNNNELFAINNRENIDKPEIKYRGNKFVFTGGFRKDLEGSVLVSYNKGFYFITLNMDEPAITQDFAFCPGDFDERFYDASRQVRLKAPTKAIEYSETVFVNGSYYVICSLWFNKGFNNKEFRKEIIITKYDQNNKFEWMKAIPRNSHGNLTGMNYIVANKLYLVYYDNPKNLIKFPDPSQYKEKKYASVGKLKSAVLVCTGIDEQSNLTRKQIDTHGELLMLRNRDADDAYFDESKIIVAETTVSQTNRRFNLLTFIEPPRPVK